MVRVQADSQLIIINARSAEFLLLYNFLAAQPLYVLKKQMLQDRGLDMDDVENLYAKFPSSILPEYRKRRQYLNSILSKNEVGRSDPYNRKLFLRIARGVYVLNPDLEILVADDRWMNVYDIMVLEKMSAERNEAIKKEDLETWRKKNAEEIEKARLRREREWQDRWNWE